MKKTTMNVAATFMMVNVEILFVRGLNGVMFKLWIEDGAFYGIL